MSLVVGHGRFVRSLKLGIVGNDRIGPLAKVPTATPGARWKALAEIYRMHPFAPFWNRIPKTRKTMGRKEPGSTPGKMDRSLSSNFCFKIVRDFAMFWPDVAKFVNITFEFADFRADFKQNLRISGRINENYWIFAENCEKCCHCFDKMWVNFL